jgi:predicted dehydrogenase
MHVPIAMECAKNNINFFVEKPLALNANEASELVKLCHKNSIKAGVGFFMRYTPSFLKAKELLDMKILGELFSFSSSILVSQLFKTGKGWRYDKSKSGGGVLIGQGIHLIDLLTFFFGKVDRVNGYCEKWYSKDTEDHSYGRISFTQNIQGSFKSNWSIRDKRVMTTTIDIYGEKGSLHVNQDQITLRLVDDHDIYKKGITIISKADFKNEVQIDIAGPEYTLENEHFINTLTTNHSHFSSDLDSAYYTQKVIDAIYKSSENEGKPIKINND